MVAGAQASTGRVQPWSLQPRWNLNHRRLRTAPAGIEAPLDLRRRCGAQFGAKGTEYESGGQAAFIEGQPGLRRARVMGWAISAS